MQDHSKLIPLLLSHIRPGSTLVVTPQLFPELRNAKGMAEVISVEALMALDQDDYHRSLKNLGQSYYIDLLVIKSAYMIGC